jgi:hypothetical protein
VNPYLLDVAAAMKAVPQPTLDMPADTITPGGAQMAPAPAVYNAPAPSAAWAPTDPLAGVAPAAPPPGTGVMQGYDPLTDTAPLNPPRDPVSFTRGDPSAEATPAGPPGPTDQRPAISLAGGGGAYEAREASRLGPSQWAALADANSAQQGAIGGMAINNAGQAQRDEDVYLQHALDARKREDAAGQVALQREDELRMRASDFDRQARMLSQEKLDPGHFWATRSTPQKVSTFIAIALGGFLSGARGGENLAMNQLNHEVEKDIKAQEVAYNMKRGGLEAAHTAYGMAMQRYQSADAARAFARVSAMDAVAAEIARQQAQGKGTESQNRAMAALAELQMARADQILKGIQYVPGGYREQKYHVANRLGTYTAKEIDQQFATEESRGFELEKIDRHNEGEIRKEGAKQGSDDAKYIANAMRNEKIPESMEASEEARKALIGSEKGYGEKVLDKLGQGEKERKFFFGKDATNREQAWKNFKNSAMKQIMGNVAGDRSKLDSEAERAYSAFESAGDNESRLNAIKLYQSSLRAAEMNIRKGASDKGNADYDTRDRKTAGPRAAGAVSPGFKAYK